MPERFKDLEEPGRYTISWSWFTPQLILMLFFCIAWDSFLFVWYGRVFGEGNTDLMAVLFPIAHVAVGIGITYSTVAGLLNRTTIETNRQRLIVRHGPVPWPGKDLPLDSIAQLYCQAREVSRKNSSTTYYDVCALLKDGTKKRLLNRFTELDQALFVEQRLERAMRITDARVPGDIRVA